MIRYIIPALLLALIVAAPAVPQGGPVPAEEQIATLVGEVSVLKEKVAKQDALLKELVAFHKTRKADNEKLAGRVPQDPQGGQRKARWRAAGRVQGRLHLSVAAAQGPRSALPGNSRLRQGRNPRRPDRRGQAQEQAEEVGPPAAIRV